MAKDYSKLPPDELLRVAEHWKKLRSDDLDKLYTALEILSRSKVADPNDRAKATKLLLEVDKYRINQAIASWRQLTKAA